MIIYIVMTIISIVFIVLSEKLKEKKKQQLCRFLACIPFFIISAIRYGVGTDYFFRYVSDYNNIANGIDVENMEIGFKLIIKFCILFSKNSQLIFIVTSALITFFIMSAIFKLSKNKTISILIFFIGGFYFQSLNLIRQFLAMAIILFSYEYIYIKGKNYFFIIAIILAFFIHSSSIVAITVLLLKNKLVLKPLIVIPIVLLISLFGNYIMQILSPIIQNTRFSVYLIGLYAKGEVSLLYDIVNVLIYAYMYIIYILKRKNGCTKNVEDILFINIQGLAVIFTFMSSIHMLFSRIAYYFMIFQIISIPYFTETNRIKMKSLNKEWIKRGLYVLVILFYISVTTYTNILNNDHEPLPYKTIINNGNSGGISENEK